MFRHIVYSLANRQGLFAYVRTCKNPTWYNNQVHGCCNIAVQSCYFFTPWQHVLSCMLLIYHDGSPRTTLFKYFRSSGQEQSVPTCMNKPVNNHVQVGQLNHVQACQQPCSSSPAQPCSSLSTTTFKLASSTMFKAANRQKQVVRFYVCRHIFQFNISNHYYEFQLTRAS